MAETFSHYLYYSPVQKLRSMEIPTIDGDRSSTTAGAIASLLAGKISSTPDGLTLEFPQLGENRSELCKPL